jgi:hypothetical protein
MAEATLSQARSAGSASPEPRPCSARPVPSSAPSTGFVCGLCSNFVRASSSWSSPLRLAPACLLPAARRLLPLALCWPELGLRFPSARRGAPAHAPCRAHPIPACRVPARRRLAARSARAVLCPLRAAGLSVRHGALRAQPDLPAPRPSAACSGVVCASNSRVESFFCSQRALSARSTLIPNLVVRRRSSSHRLPSSRQTCHPLLNPTLPARSRLQSKVVVVLRVSKKFQESGKDEAKRVIFAECATKSSNQSSIISTTTTSKTPPFQ